MKVLSPKVGWKNFQTTFGLKFKMHATILSGRLRTPSDISDFE